MTHKPRSSLLAPYFKHSLWIDPHENKWSTYWNRFECYIAPVKFNHRCNVAGNNCTRSTKTLPMIPCIWLTITLRLPTRLVVLRSSNPRCRTLSTMAAEKAASHQVQHNECEKPTSHSNFQVQVSCHISSGQLRICVMLNPRKGRLTGNYVCHVHSPPMSHTLCPMAIRRQTCCDNRTNHSAHT